MLLQLTSSFTTYLMTGRYLAPKQPVPVVYLCLLEIQRKAQRSTAKPNPIIPPISPAFADEEAEGEDEDEDEGGDTDTVPATYKQK